MRAACAQTDAVLSTHRGHHHCLAKGASPDAADGRAARPHDGLLARPRRLDARRGPGDRPARHQRHRRRRPPDRDRRGATACRPRARDDVTRLLLRRGRDAATGAFGEALNIAALWELPLVFICENNQYVELTPQSVHVAGAIWRRGESFGMPGVRVDGNDVDAVADAVERRRARARAGGGPTLVEAVTYRWFGHYAGDRAAYRDEDEVREWRARDPLARARAELDAGRGGRARRRGRGGDRRRARVRPAEPGGRARLAPRRPLRGAGHERRDRTDRDPPAEVLAGHQPGARRGDGPRRARRARRRGRRPARRALRRDARPARPLRRAARPRHADQRGGARRARRRQRRRRPAPDRRDHVLRLRDDRDGPDRQPGGEVPLLLRARRCR